MNILIFGVPCVGKTTIGKLLANKLNYDFYDLDDVIKKEYNYTIDEFIDIFTREERDSIKADLTIDLINKENNKVIAITVITNKEEVNRILENNIFAIELQDTVEHIFDRLMFYDSNDDLYTDIDEYKNKHKSYYLNMIQEDNEYFKNIFKDIKTKIFINNRTPQEIVNEIIQLMNKL